MILFFKRPFVRLLRFRHRCGYGVHSPFAFNLITGVIYQRTPYYAYKELAAEEKRLAREKPRSWRYEMNKVKRLLFRLVNEAQPRSIVDVGRPAASALYLKAAKRQTDYTAATELAELFLEAGVPVDFLYLHDTGRPELLREAFRLCAARTTPRSLFVVEGIGHNRAMRALWKEMTDDPRVSITFDLFDLGLLFFDTEKVKQHYIVNF
jgi:hypothetical protein